MKEYPSNKFSNEVTKFVKQFDYTDIGIIQEAIIQAWWKVYSIDPNSIASKFLGDVKYGIHVGVNNKLREEGDAFFKPETTNAETLSAEG